ncbi:MAG: hypothetical protein U0694_13190 [Anaerolineae bacterium]
MRLTLWPQFSSNHSSSYTVVGEFPNAQSAQQASETIQTIMREAAAWCREHHDECYRLTAPTPVELKYAEQYGIDWQERIDWMTYAVREQCITHTDRLVVVDTTHVDTWQTGHQFIDLLTVLGAKTARSVMEGREPGNQGEVWMSMGINLQCEMPSAEAAAEQAAALRKLIASMRDFRALYMIPWFIYHPALREYSAQYIHTLEKQLVQDMGEAQKLHELYALSGGDTEKLRQNQQTFHAEWAKVRILSHEQYVHLSHCHGDMGIHRAVISVEGHTLILRQISFANISLGLPAFVKYLEQLGGTHLQYTIEQY